MKQIYTEIFVNAPPSRVWQVLMDFPAYPAWNPYGVRMEGSAAEGKTYQTVVKLPGAWRMTHWVKTLRLVPEVEWTSRSHLFKIPGLVDVHFITQLVPENGGTRVVHKEHFSGLLVPLHWMIFTRDLIVRGVESFIRSLKRASEGSEALQREAAVMTRFGETDRAALERLRDSWALVTGASAGIGREFARQLAAAGLHVALVARRKDLLDALAQELSSQYGVKTLVFPADLSEASSRQEIWRELHSRSIRIRILCNIAGFDVWGYFDDFPMDLFRQMIRVNLEAPVELCHLFKDDLASHLTSVVINISSQAGLQPVPYLAVYAATRAFNLSFSLGLYGEWLRRGILVQTLLSGPVDTGTETMRLLRQERLFRKFSTAEEVVRDSLTHLTGRDPLLHHNQRPLLHRIFTAIFPARTIVRILADSFTPPQSRMMTPPVAVEKTDDGRAGKP